MFHNEIASSILASIFHQRQWLGDRQVHVGGRELHACTLQTHQQTVFVAIETTDERPGHRAAVTYYGLLVLCFCKFVYSFVHQLC